MASKIKFKMKLRKEDKGLEGRNAIPANKYMVKASFVEVLRTKADDGTMVKIIWEVVKGEYKGRKVFDNICFEHPKDITEEIARKALVSICAAFGIENEKFKDPEKQFSGKKAVITVVIEETKRGPQNNITAYDELGDFKAEKSGKKGKKDKKGKKGKKGKKPAWA